MMKRTNVLAHLLPAAILTTVMLMAGPLLGQDKANDDEPRTPSSEQVPPLNLSAPKPEASVRADQADTGYDLSSESRSDSLPESLRDPAFEPYVDLLLLGDAINTRNASLATDVALQLAHAEQVLGRRHRAMPAERAMVVAARVAARANGKRVDALKRLAKAAERYEYGEVTSQIAASEKLADQTRDAATGLMVDLTETSPAQFALLSGIIAEIEWDAIIGRKETSRELRRLLTDQSQQLSKEQQKALTQRIDSAKEQSDKADEQSAKVLQLLSGASRGSPAATKFVNLSAGNVYLAKVTFKRGSGSRPDRWHFEGWYTIKPGAVFVTKPGRYYLERRDKSRLSWTSAPDWTGLVRYGREFAPTVAAGDQVEFDRLLQGPYTKVEYQDFSDGTYTISGNAYEIARRTYRFDFNSHSINFHRKRWRVPGEVISIAKNAERRWANFSWTIGDRSVSLTGSTEGKQTNLFSGRDKGYYRGSVTVKYVRKR